MKKLIIALAALTMMTSCTNDDTTIVCCPVEPNSHWEIITCDTEDNVIKIGNAWLHNSNFDWDNWEYYQTRGFQLNDNQLTVVTTDGSKILQAELFNVDPSLVYTHRPNDHTVIFYSTDEHLMNAGDVYYVNLRIAD